MAADKSPSKKNLKAGTGPHSRAYAGYIRKVVVDIKVSETAWCSRSITTEFVFTIALFTSYHIFILQCCSNLALRLTKILKKSCFRFINIDICWFV